MTSVSAAMIAAAAAASVTQQKATFSGGSIFTNLTFGSHEAAGIDGNKSQAQAASPRHPSDNVLGYYGYSFAAPHVWSGIKLWGTTNGGFYQPGFTNNVTINVRTHSAVPTNVSEAASFGTLLATFGPTANTAALTFTNLAFVTPTSGAHVWFTISGAGASTGNEFCEWEIYEDL